MRALVTGGAGFIGSNIVEALVKRGDDVTVIDNLSTGTKDNLESVKDKIKLIESPCLELPELKLDSPDIIFHIGIPSSTPMYRENRMLVGESIKEFVAVMEFAKAGPTRVVYASTSSMYRGCKKPYTEDMRAEPFDFYTEARIAMENIAAVYNQFDGVTSAGMRFFSVYGPHERAKKNYANMISQVLWSLLKDERPLIYGDGSQTRDFTHISDIVKACLAAAEADFECEAINIGTGRETSFNQAIELLNRALGKSIEPEYTENPIKNYVSETQADITKARKLLGYEPSVELEDGIEMLIENEKK